MESKNVKELMHNISTFIFDFDGVLTDGIFILADADGVLNRMHVKDCLAIRHALQCGYRLAVITGGTSPFIKEALNKLGIEDVFLRAHDKLDVYKQYIWERDLKDSEIGYMGDNLPDYHVLKRVALKACPKNAAREIKGICNYISTYKGGTGAVYDLIEQVLNVQGKWKNEDIID